MAEIEDPSHQGLSASGVFHGADDIFGDAGVAQFGDLLGDRWSVLIFPEGERTETGRIGLFRPGVGLVGARLGVKVVPVRLEGLDLVLHKSWKMPRPGRVRVAFGEPLALDGDDYVALAGRVEAAVRAL